MTHLFIKKQTNFKRLILFLMKLFIAIQIYMTCLLTLQISNIILFFSP